MINLLNADENSEYEEYLIETGSQVYKIHFHKKLGVTSWICLKGVEDKGEIKEIFGKLDNFRLTLAETHLTSHQ